MKCMSMLLVAGLVVAGCSVETGSDARFDDQASAESSEEELHALTTRAEPYVGEYAAVDAFGSGTDGVRGLSLRSSGWYTLFRSNGANERGKWDVTVGDVVISPTLAVDHDYLVLAPLAGAVRSTTIGPTYIHAGLLLGRGPSRYLKRLETGACKPASCTNPYLACSETALRKGQTKHTCVEDWAPIVK